MPWFIRSASVEVAFNPERVVSYRLIGFDPRDRARSAGSGTGRSSLKAGEIVRGVEWKKGDRIEDLLPLTRQLADESICSCFGFWEPNCTTMRSITTGSSSGSWI